ncbi:MULTISPECIES: TetR/AcrR family transcriptional regulator [unclassified Microbacterium]|uniref:TetR/AcrR family transcriptional regulator n=1 Tax=unclassified Microbacterium TaxID=2609290 RepID=UPI000C2B7A1F|nr:MULTISPECIES: TetR/AcrR family transcriptional regulator [unclassified Microbacterium]
MNRRGAYAKGVAKREEILTTALEVIAREGLRRTSVRELAGAAGLSQAGLLHYFGSKEELYTAILRKRDELDGERFATLRGAPALAGDDEGTGGSATRSAEDGRADAVFASFLDIIRRNAGVPGLVQLFAHLSVDAATPEHAAHEFFIDRRRYVGELLAPAISELQAEGRIVDTVPAASLATIVHALADGLQTHWLLEPDLDMAGTIEALFAALDPRPVTAR